ncbi:MAG: cupin domain-containing protein [Xanthobacteraceae bacterium]
MSKETLAVETKPVASLADVPLMDWGNGDKFAAKFCYVGPIVGAKQLGCMLTIVPPGKIAFPYHAHHANEEMFVILAGSGEYRFGGKTYPIRAGDVLAAPAGGPEVAHQIVNTGSEEMRYLGISTMKYPDAVDYPDSGKFAVWSLPDPSGARNKMGLRFIGRREMAVKYWDGE